MSEQMTKKELDTLMEKLFSIDLKDVSFFRKTLSEIAKTDSGARLLRSLNANFNGKKMNLVTHAKLDSFGHCFIDENENEIEIGIGVSGIFDYYIPSKIFRTAEREVTHGYPKLLFHELTHWAQYQNQGAAENASTDEDRYFTVIMAEADAQISGDLFKMDYRGSNHLDKGVINPVWHMVKFATKVIADTELKSQKKFIIEKQDELKQAHPEWSMDRIEKETRKAFFKKSILDKNSFWRRFYDDPENRKKLGTLDEDPQFSKRELPDLMKYYMAKYGLTMDECLDLKKEILMQSNQTFGKTKTHQRDEKITSLSATPHLTNTEMLSHAARSIKPTPGKSTAASEKLDTATLRHLNSGHSGH